MFPCNSTQKMPTPDDSESEFVSRLTQIELDKHDICFEIAIQRQRDPCKDPVDNLLVAWDGPWEQVAKVTIPKGTKLQSNTERCEKLSFNPFHSHADNVPLGWISQVRKHLYPVLAEFRQ